MNRNTKQLLCLLLAFIMVLGLLPAIAFAASGTTLYLNPGPWEVDGAKFAVYYWNNSSSNWAAMTASMP